MTPRLVILWMFMGVLAAFGLYTVKYKVQTLKAEVAVAEKQLREEKQRLHVLTAEWTYLTRPERIRALAAKYLNAKPVSDSSSLILQPFLTRASIMACNPLQFMKKLRDAFVLRKA